MPGFGSKLMLKRLALGFTFRDVAKMSGLKQKQLRALEDEELMRFRDQEQIAGLLTTYAATLGLNKAEIIKDLELVWSDSSSAKNYMQQKYNKSKNSKFFGDNPFIGYGIAVGAAALLLSVGGYFYWNNITGDQSPLQEQTSISADDSSEQASVDTQTPLDSAEDLTGSSDPVDQSVGPVPQGESAVEGDNVTVSENPETNDSAALVAVNDSSADLPRASGTSYLLWVGLLTFLTGLLLFGLPAAFRERKVYADIGVFA